MNQTNISTALWRLSPNTYIENYFQIKAVVRSSVWPPSLSILQTIGQCAVHMFDNKAQSSSLKRRHSMAVAASLQYVILSLYLFITPSPSMLFLLTSPTLCFCHVPLLCGYLQICISVVGHPEPLYKFIKR